MRLAGVFPGQGSQHVGMGKDIYDNYPELRWLFDLDKKTRDLMFTGTEEELKKTRNAQPALYIADLAYFYAMKLFLDEEEMKFDAVIGDSVGELPALAASGVLTPRDGLYFTHARAEAMTELLEPSEKPPMYAVITEDYAAIQEACERASQNGRLATVSKINSRRQRVIAGHGDALEQAAQYLSEKGIKAIPLNVEGPFHTKIMENVGRPLEDLLRCMQVRGPKIPFASNYTGDLMPNNLEIRRAMVQAIFNPVLLQSAYQSLHQMGITDYVECGPGNVQTKMLKRDYGFAVRDRSEFLRKPENP